MINITAFKPYSPIYTGLVGEVCKTKFIWCSTKSGILMDLKIISANYIISIIGLVPPIFFTSGTKNNINVSKKLFVLLVSF